MPENPNLGKPAMAPFSCHKNLIIRQAGKWFPKGTEKLLLIYRVLCGIKYSEQKYHSQFGEDMIIDFTLNFLVKHNFLQTINYLDIGGNHPENLNNTFFLYHKGFSGVVVEPNPNLAREFAKARVRDKVLQIGIYTSTEETKQIPFYLFKGDTDGASSFDKASADAVVEKIPGSSYETILTEVKTINEIIEEHFGGAAPVFISIDCEGLDFEILKSLDFKKYAPVLLCVETAAPCIGNVFGAKESEIAAYMQTVGYVVLADTYVNTIFIQKTMLDKMLMFSEKCKNNPRG